MTQTANDICRIALREIGVLGIGQDMATEDFDHANEQLDLLMAELTGEPRRLPITWTTAAVPDRVAAGLAQTLGTRIGRPYNKIFTRQNREEAMNLLLSLVVPDDRTSRDSEVARKQAAFM